ncbi:MAG: hypothetical protein JST27_01175 [Bacteroidetes bacterium]|nr:hypothetical protein [Bacteroidota bacterium]
MKGASFGRDGKYSFSSLFNPKIMSHTQLAYEAAHAGSSRNLRVPTHTHTA